jgi:hypothetical protein
MVGFLDIPFDAEGFYYTIEKSRETETIIFDNNGSPYQAVVKKQNC